MIIVTLGNCAFCEISGQCNKWKGNTIVWSCPDFVELGDKEKAKEVLSR